MNNRVIDIDGVLNVRDLGGLSTGNGNLTKNRKFLRAAALHEITDQGKEEFKNLGISDVIDLRSIYEVDLNPDPHFEDLDIKYHNIPMLDHLHSHYATGEPPKVKFKALEELYEDILLQHKSEITKTFDILADSSGGVMFHCTVGKDRTGLTAMFILTLADVPKDIIIQDYSLSESFLAPHYKKDKSVPEIAYVSPPMTMKTTLDWLNENFGGPTNYLNEINVSKEAQAAVRDKLILP